MDPERLSILVDENVAYARESFGRVGSVRVLPGRRITAADVERVDVLIVRSVTRVNEALLAGSSVKFVGTATIGCDHVDVEYLRGRGIAFASAPGSNATSVAEYIVAALLLSAHARQRPLEGSALAVIGVGNVGARVAEKASALGMRCVLNDPPRQRNSHDPAFVARDEALSQAEYVTLHVPLERTGPDATVGMAGRAFFDLMQSDAVFLNTSRGAVVDEEALASALDSGRVSHAVLDVWQREPDIDPQMVGRAFLATPHIAGYRSTARYWRQRCCSRRCADGSTRSCATDSAEARARCADLDLSGLLPEPAIHASISRAVRETTKTWCERWFRPSMTSKRMTARCVASPPTPAATRSAHSSICCERPTGVVASSPTRPWCCRQGVTRCFGR